MVESIFPEATEGLYFLNRLKITSELKGLPASGQYDLARSTLANKHLQQLRPAFGVQEPKGWGFADLMNHVIRNDPETIPTTDLAELQGNLVRAGYLPPDTPITGEWDEDFSAALSNFESDNRSKFYSGHHPGSIPVMAAVAQLGNIFPSRVFQGLVGAAKGFALQAPETASRVGALGGAAAGAALGASLGSVLPGAGTAAGAVIGAIGGAIAGFFGDLISQDADEENQSAFGAFADALTPFEEYAGNSHAFFEDLGWVATGSSLILGVGSGIGAAAKAATALKGAEALTAAGEGDLAAAILGAGNAEVRAGWMARIAGQPVKLFSATKYEQWLGIVEKVGPRAMSAKLLGTPAGKIAFPLYTGASEAQMGARLFAGFGQGGAGIIDDWSTNFKIKNGRDPTEAERDRFASKHAPSTIEQAIAAAPHPQSGIDIPFMGDLVDLPGWVIWPSHFLPWRMGDWGKAVAGATKGTESWFKPFVNANATVHGLQGEEAVTRTVESLGSNDAERLTSVVATIENFGLDMEAMAVVKRKGIQLWDPAFRGALRNARYDLGGRLVKELGEEHVLAAGEALKRADRGETSGKLIDDIMSWAVRDPLDDRKGPYALEGYLMSLEARGAGMTRGPNFLKANEIAKGLTTDAREGLRLPDIIDSKGALREAIPGKVLPQEAVRLDDLKIEIKRLEEDIERRTLEAAERTVDPHKAQWEFVRLRKDEERLVEMQDRFLELKKYKRASWADRAIVPERLDTPTGKDFFAWAKEYKKLSNDLVNASLEGDVGAIQIGRERVAQFVDDHRAYLRPQDIDRALRGERSDARRIVRHLKEMGKKSAIDVVYDEATMKSMADLGYKPVMAQSNNVFFTPNHHLTEVLGFGDYSRRENMWTSLGLGLDAPTNKALNAARAGHQKWEVSLELHIMGKRETQDQIYNRLWSALRAKRDGRALTNESIRAYAPWADEMVDQHGLISIARRAISGIAIDIRDLTPADIFEATKDFGYSFGEAKKIYGAIKRGGALGGEFHLFHPVQSAHLIAKNMRASGLPGLTDALRTWHAELPGEVPRGFREVPKPSYRIPDELARSPEVGRVSREVREAAVAAGVDADETLLLEQTLHSLLQGMVRSGHFPTVDTAAASLSVDFAEKFAAEGRNWLYKRIFEQPTMKQLDRLVSTYKKTGGFSDYEASQLAIHDTFGGQYVKLGDGRVVAQDDLMTQLIAVTSSQVLPSANLTFAMKALKQHLAGEPIVDVSRAGAEGDKIVADILSGHTIDRWSPALRKSREKFAPFYDALRGDPDALVIDRRIKLVHGLDPNAAVPEAERLNIRTQYEALRDRHGIPISSIQASIWTGFVDHFAGLAKKAERAGRTEEAAMYRQFVTDAAKDTRGYNDLLANPTKAQRQYLDFIKGQVPPIEVMAKKVGDDILGATAFGPDYTAMMRIFSGADFSTFTHEYGHLLQRMLPPEILAEVEKAYGVTRGAALPGLAVDLGEARAVKDIASSVKELVSRTKKGGATFNPHTGRYPKKGFAVAVQTGTMRIVEPGEDLGQVIREFAVEHAEMLRGSRAHIGTWKDDAGRVHLDVSEVHTSRETALRAGAERDQEAIYDLGKGEEIPVPVDLPRGPRWTQEQSEAFANDIETYFRGRKAEPAKRSFLEILRQSTGSSWERYRGYVRDKNLIDPTVRRRLDEYFGDIFDAAKTDVGPRGVWGPGRRALAGSAVGASLGLIEGDDKVEDAIRGAVLGAAGGMALNILLKRSYGYLPDYLTKVGQALRFSLSPSFDARRFTKGQLLAMMHKEELPFMGISHRAIENRIWPSLYNKGSEVTRDAAWREAIINYQELHGVGYFEDLDSFERTLTSAGILGYNPRQREIAYSYMLAQRGRTPTQIRKTMSEVFGYGYGRTQLEKTVNFIFFPFSFEKKLLTTVGDFILQAPGRAILIHEGLKRYQESKWDDKIGEFLDRHVPLLQNLQNFNAFAHGLSPGRFLLEGMWDHRTRGAEAAQVISTFLLMPGGAAITPVNQAIGGFGDLAVHAFIPIAMTGESITDATGGDLETGTGVDQILDMARRYVPFVGDLNEFFTNAHDQLVSVVEGEAPWAQLHDYLDRQARYKQSLGIIAQITGHKTVDGYLASTDGVQAKAAFDQFRMGLRDEYPTGFQMSTGFEDTSQLADKAMYDVMQKVAGGHGNAAEEAIATIGSMQMQTKQLTSTLTSVDPAVFNSLSATQIRSYAAKYVDDVRFVELWNKLLAWKYGPLRVVI